MGDCCGFGSGVSGPCTKRSLATAGRPKYELIRSHSARLSCCRKSAAAGSARNVSTPPEALSLSLSGRAMRAVSDPAISVQRKTSVGSRKPARTKAALAAIDASRPTASARARLCGGSSRCFSREDASCSKYGAERPSEAKGKDTQSDAIARLVRRAPPGAALAGESRQKPIPIASG